MDIAEGDVTTYLYIKPQLDSLIKQLMTSYIRDQFTMRLTPCKADLFIRIIQHMQITTAQWACLADLIEQLRQYVAMYESFATSGQPTEWSLLGNNI